MENIPEIVEKFKELSSELEKSDSGQRSLDPLEREYRFARENFETGNYQKSAGLTADLIKTLLAGIIKSNHMELHKDPSFREAWQRSYENAKGLEPGLESTSHPVEWSLPDLCSIYDEAEIWKLLAGVYMEQAPLLRSFKWSMVPELVEVCKLVSLSTKDEEANREYQIQLGVQQLLCVAVPLLRVYKEIEISPYHLLANFTDMSEEIKQIRASHTKLSEISSRLSYIESVESEVSIRPFQWIKFRGMLINATDSSRNISFKVETLVNMLSTIHQGIRAWCLPNDDTNIGDISTLASKILFESGYRSGANFGWTMHEIFQKDHRELQLQDKIELWCEFDSDVGFGFLSLPDDGIKEEKGEKNKISYTEISIRVKLSHNFLAYRRETSQTNLCSFMCGYIQGVLEKVTGQPLKVNHDADECEQFVADLDHCTYHISTDSEKLVRDLLNAKGRFSQGYSPSLPTNGHNQMMGEEAE